MNAFTDLPWTDLLVAGHFLINLFLAIRVIYSRRSTGSALGWLVFIFAVPYIGTVTYLLIGETRLGNKRMKRQSEIHAFYKRFNDAKIIVHADKAMLAPVHPRFVEIARLAFSDTGLAISSQNQCQLLTDTDTILTHFIADITRAKHTCLMMFYIIDSRARVLKVLEALIAAAQRGVRCQLLVDAVGSKAFLRSEWPSKLRAAGVLVTSSLPVGPLKTFFVRSDLRNHRKLLIVDYEIGYTGSYNLVDPEVFKAGSGVGQWVDAVLRCEGSVAKVLAGVFYADWAVENKENFKKTLSILEGYVNSHPPKLSAETLQSDALLQVIPSAPSNLHYVVYNALVSALYAARESIIISTPYFVPDEPLLLALETAASRGVKVTIILPRHVDSWLVRKASRAYYQPLLQSGVEITMYAKGLLHTKTVLIDDAFAIFGTVNMDMRSFYLNMEVSLGVYDQETVTDISSLLQSYLRDCQPVTLKAWQKRPQLQRFVERCVRLASPIL